MSVTFRNNSRQVREAMNRGINAGLIKIGIAGKRNIQDKIVENRQLDTEEMHRTIDYNVREADKSVDIGSPKDYAPFQELGTSRQQGRPFIRPGILNNTDEYKELVQDAIRSTMR